MFRAIILLVFRSTRLCVAVCGIMHPRCCRPPAGKIVGALSCNTQSSAPEDEQNNCPKHVGLTGVINKPLLLHLVRCLYYLYQWCTVKKKKISDNEIYMLIKYIKSVLWRVAKRLSYTEDEWCLKVNLSSDSLQEIRQQLWPFSRLVSCTLQALNLPWHNLHDNHRSFFRSTHSSNHLT